MMTQALVSAILLINGPHAHSSMTVKIVLLIKQPKVEPGLSRRECHLEPVVVGKGAVYNEGQ